MFNEKALKRITPKVSKPDRFDIEAEAEGRSINFMQKNEVGPHVLGRRISRERHKADGYAKTAEKRATDNLVHDTAEVAKNIIARSLPLIQR